MNYQVSLVNLVFFTMAITIPPSVTKSTVLFCGLPQHGWLLQNDMDTGLPA